MRTSVMIELSFLEGMDGEPDHWFAEYYVSGDSSSTEHFAEDLGDLLTDVFEDARSMAALGTPIQWLDGFGEPLAGQLRHRVDAVGVQLRDKV